MFEDIFVSTDSKKIKTISEKYGAKVPFLRNKKLSNDKTPVIQVIEDAVKKIEVDYKFDNSIRSSIGDRFTKKTS